MNTRIAINQLNPKSNVPEVNFQTIKKTISKNAHDGANLCIFPEDYLFGVLRNRTQIVAAGKQFHQWVSKFRELAKRYKVDLVPGTLPSSKYGKLYNTTVYIDKSGKILMQYSKNNLWLSERDEYHSSLQLPVVFKCVLGRTAVIICWDIFDHYLFDSAIREGAQWIIVVSFWSNNQSKDLALRRGVLSKKYQLSDSNIIDTVTMARVIEYNVGIIFCNFGKIHHYIGQDKSVQKAISAGHSQIIGPYNNGFDKLNNRDETFLLYDINIQESAESLNDFEISYGRRDDVINAYPYNNLIKSKCLE